MGNLEDTKSEYTESLQKVYTRNKTRLKIYRKNIQEFTESIQDSLEVPERGGQQFFLWRFFK